GWEVVPLPPPFGRRPVFNFDCADYDVLPALTGTAAMTVKVGFELRSITAALAALAHTGWRFGKREAAFLAWACRFTRGLGCSAGAVRPEAGYADGNPHRAAIVAPTAGQRIAAVPCALAAKALLDGVNRPGACTAYELLGPDQFLRDLVAAG